MLIGKRKDHYVKMAMADQREVVKTCQEMLEKSSEEIFSMVREQLRSLSKNSHRVDVVRALLPQEKRNIAALRSALLRCGKFF